MNDYLHLTQAIKSVLRARNLRYSDMAKALNLAESSVKRIPNSQDGSVERLCQMAKYLGLSFMALMDMAAQEQETVYYLTEEQDQIFSNNLKLFEFYDLLSDEQKTPREICREFEITQRQAISYMKKLAKAGMLEFISFDKFRLLPVGTLNLGGG